jgi:hypothetical protein
MVRLAPRYCEWTRREGIDLRTNVHDSLVWHGEAQQMRHPQTVATIVAAMEDMPVPFKVPFRFDAKWSDRSWSDCDKNTIKAKDVRRELALEVSDHGILRRAVGAGGWADPELPAVHTGVIGDDVPVHEAMRVLSRGEAGLPTEVDGRLHIQQGGA